MNNELTKQDIAIMQQELDHLRLTVLPDAIEEVKRTRAFGDLSENYEYKAAKQAQNACKKRIRYLERMIKSATVIEDNTAEDEVGLFDLVELYFEDDEECQTVSVVTTVRCDPRQGRISKESPMGKALLGKRVGDRFQVCATENYSYFVQVRSITKGEDDGSAPIL
ncbi:MAG: GreA/GreB family elongation factor [Oscillospiraceae bacterium]|nr:GreA/GreB family elongation factor [Oscillospiraceae bacterium]